MAFYAIGFLVRFVSTYNIYEKSGKVNGYAPFSVSRLTSWGNSKRQCSVFLTQVIGHQHLLFPYVNGNAPFSVRFGHQEHHSRNR